MKVRQGFRSLFQKYFLVLFMAVAIPLAINGVIEAWFGYRDQRARLDQLLGVQATSAAAEIHDFINGITNDLGWLVQLPSVTGGGERRGQPQLEHRAPADRAVHLDCALVRFHDRLDDRQSESESTGLTAASGIEPVEPAKDPVRLGSRDSRALVLHRQDDGVTEQPGTQLDLAPCVGMVDRVLDQRVQRKGQPVGVCVHPGGCQRAH